MTVTVRTYNTGTNWGWTQFSNTLQSAFADVGFLSADDRGIAEWDIIYNTNVTATAATGKYHRGLPIGCSMAGAVPPGWMMYRDGIGAMNVATTGAVRSGSGFRGKATHSGTWSQTGTTVTVTLKLHGLVGNTEIYATAGGTGASTGYFTAVVLNENQIAYTVPTSGTFSGTMSLHAFVGNYSISGTTVTIVSQGHNLVNGSRVYLTPVTGTLLTQLTSPISIVDQDTFTFTLPSAGAGTGLVRLYHTITVDGASTGGITGTDDIYISVVRAGGACGSPTTFSGTGYSSFWGSNYVLWKMKNDETKVLGSQYLKIHWQGTTIRIIQTPTFDIQQDSFGSAIQPTRTNDNVNHLAPTINSGLVNNLVITSYQSGLDPDFVVFTFRQANIFRTAYIFHKFKPIASAPYTLDELAHGSYTVIHPETDMRFEMMTSSGLITAERTYTGTTTAAQGLSLSSTIYPSTINTIVPSGQRLFQNRVFPGSVNFGPLVNKLPINAQVIPSFYTMPDDFGLITVGTDAVYDNDTITASPTEVYRVIRAATSTEKVAFVCRTV